MDLNSLDGKLIVITGGSSGIGYAIGERLARRGARLLLVARNEEKLREAAAKMDAVSKYDVQILSADITLAGDVRHLKATVQSLAPCVDIIINSAGIVSAGLLDEVPLGEWHRLHNVNVNGLIQVLQALVPAMRKQCKQDSQERHIVNVSSAAGHIPFPGMSAYSATKAAIIALSESLRGELAAYGIGVSAVCPGFVQTPIVETVQLFGSMDNPETQKIVRRMFSTGNLTPETVAEKTLAAISKNRGMIVIGGLARFGYTLKRISPALLARMVKTLNPASS